MSVAVAVVFNGYEKSSQCAWMVDESTGTAGYCCCKGRLCEVSEFLRFWGCYLVVLGLGWLLLHYGE